jgi:hypothetical protein
MPRHTPAHRTPFTVRARGTAARRRREDELERSEEFDEVLRKFNEAFGVDRTRRARDVRRDVAAQVEGEAAERGLEGDTGFRVGGVEGAERAATAAVRAQATDPGFAELVGSRFNPFFALTPEEQEEQRRQASTSRFTPRNPRTAAFLRRSPALTRATRGPRSGAGSIFASRRRGPGTATGAAQRTITRGAGTAFRLAFGR